MFRILLSVVVGAVSWFEFLGWARNETEGQIDRMQNAAFDTPGAEPPVPLPILVAAAGMITGHFAVSRILRLKRWHSVLSLLLGVAAAALLLVRPKRVY